MPGTSGTWDVGANTPTLWFNKGTRTKPKSGEKKATHDIGPTYLTNMFKLCNVPRSEPRDKGERQRTHLLGFMLDSPHVPKDGSDFTEPHWQVAVGALEFYPVDQRRHFCPSKI